MDLHLLMLTRGMQVTSWTMLCLFTGQDDSLRACWGGGVGGDLSIINYVGICEI